MKDLDRIKKLAGILNESVSAVPGLNQQEPNEIDEMFDKLHESLNSEEEDLIRQYMSGEIDRETFMQQMNSMAYTDHSMHQGEMGLMGDDTPAGHRAWRREEPDWEQESEFDAQDGGSTDEWGDAMDGWDDDDVVDESAPPGMEDLVMKLKKEYPGEHEKAFATAWSIYNKKHGKTEESGPGMEECSMIEEGAFKEVIQQKIQRAQELKDSMVDPEEASEIIAAELEQEGHSPQDILNILDAVAEELEGSDDEDHDHYCTTCDGTGIGQHGDPDTSRCSSCGGTGVARSEDDYDEDPPERDPYDDIYEEIDDSETEEVEEAFDLNNGYDDINYAKGSDYFPDGADSPVVKTTGAAGARQGDNPEQKKMAVAETHKELVYNYRKFLKESAKK